MNVNSVMFHLLKLARQEPYNKIPYACYCTGRLLGFMQVDQSNLYEVGLFDADDTTFETNLLTPSSFYELTPGSFYDLHISEGWLRTGIIKMKVIRHACTLLYQHVYGVVKNAQVTFVEPLNLHSHIPFDIL